MSDPQHGPRIRTPGMIPTGTGILILLLVVALQYIITQVVGGFGSNPDVVSYVGFAGTIVSIILAVLAIVYSYFQTFTQQRDSLTLAGQIDVLRATVDSVRVATQGLSKDLDRMGELNDKLDRSISLSEESRSATVAVHSQLAGLQEKISQLSTHRARGSSKGLDVEAIARLLVDNAVSSQRAVYYALLLTTRAKLGINKGSERFITPTNPAVAVTLDSFFTGIWYSLADLGLITNIGLTDPSDYLVLHPAFERAIESASPRWMEPDPDTFLDVASIVKAQGGVTAKEPHVKPS